MSDNTDQPGPSRIKRKSSDPDVGHGEIKFKAEEKSLQPSGDVNLLEDDLSEDDSTAKLGDYLSAQYEVLLRVLNNLPAFDLRRAAQVSKSWQSAARVVQNSRLQLHWLFWRANNGGWNVPPPLALYSSICEHVYSQPVMCIAFFTKTAIKSVECSSPDIVCPVTKEKKCCGKLHPMESYMSLALGPGCEIQSFTVSGIIGSSFDLQSTFEVEHIKGRIQSMSAALFPVIPGVKILKFKMSHQELLRATKNKPAEHDLPKQLGIPSDMLIQALILLTGHRVRSPEISMLVSHLQARQEHRFAVAGGIGEKADIVEGLVFLGDAVCAASLVIPETVTEKDTVVEHIAKIKNCNLPNERSMCFMFTCLGRGTMWYMGDEDVESSIINKMFPGCPVIGFFGRGETGLNFLPTFSQQDSRSFWQNFQAICRENSSSLQAPPKPVRRGELSLDHTYSTCVLYLSFNASHSNLPL